MLTAYFDESGTHAASSVAMIGGFIAPAASWKEFDIDWKAQLARLEVPSFHASECDAGRGIYRSLSRPLRDALFNGLARVVAKHKPLAVTTAVTRRHWEETRARGIDIFDDPYHACFEFCLQHLSKWAKRDAIGEPIELVFAEQIQHEPGARSLYELYRRNPRWGNEFVSLTFARADKVPGLQAADLIVYEKTRHELARHKESTAPHRPAIQIMAEADVQVIDFPYDAGVLNELTRNRDSKS